MKLKPEYFTAVVPVAGAGTRLRPHTYTYPKVLLTVGNKPILGHIIDRLLEAGIRKMCFITGYMGDKIKNYIGTAYPGLAASFVEQTEQKGLGHAVWLSGKKVNGPAIVMLGDTIISADLKKFMNCGSDCLAVKEVSDPRRFGVVELSGDNIISMTEKPENPKTNLAIVGIYCFRDSSDIYSALNNLVDSGRLTRGEIQLTDALADMVAAGHTIKALPIEGWFDCGKPDTLLETNRYILGKGVFPNRTVNSLVIPPVYISPSADVRESIIGPYVSVGDGARIERAIVSDSIINEYAVLKDISLGRSLIGPHAVVHGAIESVNVGENSEIIFDMGSEK